MPGKLASLIRSKHPGAYDDMDDATLERSVLAKYPQYADLAKDDGPKVVSPDEPGTFAGGFIRSLKEQAPEYARSALNALPGVGALVGGVLSTPETFGAGTVPGIALGAGAGRGLRDLIGHYTGLDKPTTPQQKALAIGGETAIAGATAAVLPGVVSAVKAPMQTLREGAEQFGSAMPPAIRRLAKIMPSLPEAEAGPLLQRPAWQTWPQQQAGGPDLSRPVRAGSLTQQEIADRIAAVRANGGLPPQAEPIPKPRGVIRTTAQPMTSAAEPAAVGTRPVAQPVIVEPIAQPPIAPASIAAQPETVTLYHGSPSELTELYPGSMMTDQASWAAGYTTRATGGIGPEQFAGKVHAVEVPLAGRTVTTTTLHGAERKLLELGKQALGRPPQTLREAATAVNEKMGIEAIIARRPDGSVAGAIPLRPSAVANTLDPAETVSDALARGEAVPENIQAALKVSRTAPPAASPPSSVVAQPAAAATPPADSPVLQALAERSGLRQPRVDIGAARVGRTVGMTKEEVRMQTGPILGETLGEASPILPEKALQRIIDTLKQLPKGGPEREAYVAKATSGKAQWQIENIRRTLEHLGLLVAAPVAGGAMLRDALMERMRGGATTSSEAARPPKP